MSGRTWRRRDKLTCEIGCHRRNRSVRCTGLGSEDKTMRVVVRMIHFGVDGTGGIKQDFTGSFLEDLDRVWVEHALRKSHDFLMVDSRKRGDVAELNSV